MAHSVDLSLRCCCCSTGDPCNTVGGPEIYRCSAGCSGMSLKATHVTAHTAFKTELISSATQLASEAVGGSSLTAGQAVGSMVTLE